MNDSFSFIHALFLGIVQGLTEFLPVSSSGHLAFFQTLFGFSKEINFVFFNVLCHAGTLFAILIVLKKDILKALTSKKEFLLLTTALLPLFFLLPFMGAIKELFKRTEWLGLFFIGTALILYLGSFNYGTRPKTFKSALFIGISQSLALFPGISRSGATLLSARVSGWTFDQALRFSFLLSIPTIFGALFLESLHLIKEGGSSIPNFSISIYFAAFTASFLSGLFSLKWILKRFRQKELRLFSLYCFLMGLLSLYLFAF